MFGEQTQYDPTTRSETRYSLPILYSFFFYKHPMSGGRRNREL